MKQQLILRSLEELPRQKLIKSYQSIKSQLDQVRGQETIRKYKLLSKAYKLGFKIYGLRNFTVRMLSNDMDIPYTTVHRCLSLSKANYRTWQLIKQNKISAFKAAQVLATKTITYQDEFIDIVIKNKLSTYQIKKLRSRQSGNVKDIRIARQQASILKGYSRQSAAVYQFTRAIERLDDFLSINKDLLTPEGLINIEQKLRNTSKLINVFLEAKK